MTKRAFLGWVIAAAAWCAVGVGLLLVTGLGGHDRAFEVLRAAVPLWIAIPGSVMAFVFPQRLAAIRSFEDHRSKVVSALRLALTDAGRRMDSLGIGEDRSSFSLRLWDVHAAAFNFQPLMVNEDSEPPTSPIDHLYEVIKSYGDAEARGLASTSIITVHGALQQLLELSVNARCP